LLFKLLIKFSLLDILAGWDLKDSTTVQEPFEPIELYPNFSINNLTIGIPLEYHSPGLDEQVLKIWSDTATVLEALGANVVPVNCNQIGDKFS